MSEEHPRRHLELLSNGLGRSVELALLGSAEPAAQEYDDTGLLQVGELARLTGKTVRALHLYEGLGLLRPVQRSECGYRLYSAESVIRVRWIVKLQHLGLSLAEIQELARAHEECESAHGAAAQLGAVYRAKLVEARARLAQLRELERELAASVRFLESCDTSCQHSVAQSIGCQTCDLHGASSTPPELVAGARAH